jgi:ABC-type tungstate transport system permease subunit
MTNQTLVSDRPVEASTSLVAATAAQTTVRTTTPTQQSRLLEAMKSQYRVDQQVKFLHLQAETESLLQQLKAIQKRRQTTASVVK